LSSISIYDQLDPRLAEVDRPGRNHHADRTSRPNHAPTFSARSTIVGVAASAPRPIADLHASDLNLDRPGNRHRLQSQLATRPDCSRFRINNRGHTHSPLEAIRTLSS
jgi:hypothetical protein